MDILSYLLGKNSSGGGGGDLDWESIGYSSTPKSIVDAYNYAKYIQDNWQDDTSRPYQTFESVVIFPLVSLGNRTGMNYFAYGCKLLLQIPQLDTSNIDNFQAAFSNCSALQSIPLLDTKKATSMSSMFNYCNSLKSVPLFDMSNVTNASDMFYSCTSLTEVPAFNTSKVTNTQRMFYGCTSLQTVPIFDLGRVTGLYTMFGNCSNLSDTSLDNILQMCVNMTSYTGAKNLLQLGFSASSYPTSRIQALPHYQDFINAGWAIGY